MKWYLKQLLPRTYVSKYRIEDRPALSVWKMWLGRCYDVRHFALAE